MRLRSFGFVVAAFAALAPACQPAYVPVPPPPAPGLAPPAPEPLPPPPPEIVSVVIHGQGNGHGRGLSQWGAFGLAVNHGYGWAQILDHYYGGTVHGTVGNDAIRIRLMALDNWPRTNVISASWNGHAYPALEAESIGGNRYNLWGAPSRRCGGGDDWVLLAAAVAGPIHFTPHGDRVGVCQPNESVIHYRGSVIATNDSSGATHTINELFDRGIPARCAAARGARELG